MEQYAFCVDDVLNHPNSSPPSRAAGTTESKTPFEKGLVVHHALSRCDLLVHSADKEAKESLVIVEAVFRVVTIRPVFFVLFSKING